MTTSEYSLLYVFVILLLFWASNVTIEQGSLLLAWSCYTVDVTRIDERAMSQARALAETVSIFSVTPIL